jgi:protein involved in ribonucleotide reduction
MRITLLILLLTSFLNAQEREHTCRTVFLNGPDQKESDYYLFDGVSSQKIELPRLNLQSPPG